MPASRHANTLLECAHQLYRDGRLCDTELRVGEKSLAVHRVVLVAYSSYFSSIVSGGKDEVLPLESLELKFECVAQLVNFMYTGVLEVGECALDDLNCAAKKLQMSGAAQVIEELVKRNVKLEEEKHVKDEGSVPHNEEEDNGVKEEPDSDYDYDKDIQEMTSQNDAEVTSKKYANRRTRGRQRVSEKRTITRAAAQVAEPAKSRKISATTKSRSKRKKRPEKLDDENGEDDKDTAEDVDLNKDKEVKKFENEEMEPENETAEFTTKMENEIENEQRVEGEVDIPEITEDSKVKAHIVRTTPQPIKPYRQQDGSYKCPEEHCDFTSMNDKTFKRHWRQHTGEKPYKCSECDKEFSDLKYIYEHLPTHSDDTPFGCSICQKKFKTKKNLSRHFNNHHKEEIPTYTCIMCNGKFNSKYGLNTHERSVHGLKPSTVCQHPGCGYSAPTPSELKKHQVKHIPREERAKIMCDICGSLFVSPKCLRSHLRFMHYGEPQKCPFCTYTTPAKHLLMGHCARVHKCTLEGVAVEPKFFCNLCDFKCYHKHEYKCHQMKHAEDLPHKCTYCTFATHMKGTLVKHLRTHTKERPFSCKLCGKTFTNHSSLAMHNRSHLGIKPHKCTLCDKAFASSSTLKEHMFSHQNISPFMCHICCYGCVRKNILRKHIITKHGADTLPPDMVFKRGYPPLQGMPPEQEVTSFPSEVNVQGQFPVSSILQQQLITGQEQQQQQKPPIIDQQQQQPVKVQNLHPIATQHQQQPITVQQPQQQPVTMQQQVVLNQPVVLEVKQQSLQPTKAVVAATTCVNASFNTTLLKNLENNQPQPSTLPTETTVRQQSIQQISVVDLHSSQARDNSISQPITSLETVTSRQGQTSLDSSDPVVANQMPGQVFHVLRQANHQETPHATTSQSGNALQTSGQNQPMTAVFTNAQQPLNNQPGYPEYQGYISNSQVSLIQQMYLQNYSNSNLPQQQPQ